MNDDEWKNDPRTVRMFRLLLEARDALPAIQMSAARLYGLDLTLADRIEDAIEPWRIPSESGSAHEQ
jgi:hypothetical protein